MIKKEQIYNYFLILGFILLLVLFLISMVMISRYVLSDTTYIGKHVQSTKGLLEDINEVEEVTTAMNKNSTINVYDVNFEDDNFLPVDISKIYYYNKKNKNESVMTFVINKSIYEYNNSYYYIVDDINQLEKGDLLLYVDNNIIKKGFFVDREEDSNKNSNFLLVIYDIYEKKIIKINKDNLVGKIFFEK